MQVQRVRRLGFSFMEVVVVLSITVILLSVSSRLALGWQRDIQLQHIGHALEARIVAAMQTVKLSGLSINLVRASQGKEVVFYIKDSNGQRKWHQMMLPSQFAFELPAYDLDHPTLGGRIRQAWPDAVSREWNFTAAGQSGATLVISDGKRSLCMVVAASGQVRTFWWREHEWRWQILL